MYQLNPSSQRNGTTLVVLGAVLTIGGFLPTPSHAADTWQASIGTFIPVDLPSGTRDGAGLTLNIGHAIGDLHPEDTIRLSTNLRFTEYSLKDDQRIRLYSPTLEFKKYLTPGKHGSVVQTGLTVGAGAGLVFGHNSAGGSTSHFAYTLFVGYELKPVFFETRLLRGTQSGEHGIAISLGAKW
jgi:hypothetical protein